MIRPRPGLFRAYSCNRQDIAAEKVSVKYYFNQGNLPIVSVTRNAGPIVVKGARKYLVKLRSGEYLGEFLLSREGRITIRIAPELHAGKMQWQV